MVSKIHRRSGNAVVQHCKILKWNPDIVWQVGVGLNHQEIDCLLEEWPDTKMIGFEPHPVIFKRIKDEFPGILINAAVSDECKTVTLYSKRRHKDGSSLFPPDNQETTPIEGIQTTYLDHESLSSIRKESVDRNDRVLLWLDCEGGELDVLYGARDFIEEVGMVNVEMTGAPNNAQWCDPEEVHTLLHEDGFFLQITHTNRPSSGQYDGLYVRKEIFNPGYCNCPMEVTRYRKACNE